MRGLCCGLACLLATAVPSREAFSADQYRVIPNISGQSPAMARQLLRLSELELADGVFYIAPQHWRKDIRAGVLYLQTPPARTPLRREGVVAGWTFARAEAGRETVKAPDLTGANVAEAKNKLEDCRLVLMKTAATRSAKGRVVADQYPRPGQPVFEGTHVFVNWKAKAE